MQEKVLLTCISDDPFRDGIPTSKTPNLHLEDGKR